MNEIITGSTDTSQKGKTKLYIATIKEKDSPVRLFFDDFAADQNADGVSCEIGLNLKGGFDVPTNFIFTARQVIPGTTVTIERGNGSINELGTALIGEYHTSYIANGKPQVDTIRFTGSYKQ